MKNLTNRILMHLALIILLSFAAIAKPISLEEAKEIAMQHNLQMNKYSIELQNPSAYKLIASSHDVFSKSAENPTFYIYNFPQKGWVIVSGDDIARPILAYSKEDSYSLENLHDNAKYWLEIYDSAISEAIKKGVSQSEKIANEWLMARNPKKRTSLLDEVVPPLIKTKWGQDSPYNDLCPYNEEAKKRTLTGCIATTMAQIMKYWNFPTNGREKKAYIQEPYGELSADFENTTYDWDNMPNEYNQNSTEKEIKAVATLMYHCGVASSMEYGIEASGAFEGYLATSLLIYFMYDDNIKIIIRSDYDDNAWKDTLKKNLDNGQPIAYSGKCDKGGHSFVCDGYDTDGRFHFNLGWNGTSNGYYYIDNITKLKLNLWQNAVINVKPNKEFTSQISLVKPLELQQEIVYQNSTVKINANILNNSSGNFSGSISLRLFDAEDNFLMTIAEQEIDELEPNQPIEITFETNPLFNTAVGSYYVKLYDKNIALNQWLVSSGINKLVLNVQKPLSSESQLSLYSLPILSSYNIHKDKETDLKVTASFTNTSEADFTGVISASIYDEKGNIIKDLARYNVTETLAPNDHIKDIEFSNTILDLDYGIYFIGFRSKDENGEFALVNTNNFISFIKFEIVLPELITDPQLKKWINFNTHQLPGVFVNEYGEIDNIATNLEALSKIETLSCTSFKLTSIDELIRHMPNLKRLECYNNSLIELDISKNINLEELFCNDNNLNNLDVTNNINLTILLCSGNYLSNLDITNNIDLIALDCSENQITELDISKNIGLILLACSQNQLNNLDVTDKMGLMFLNCSKNQLTDIDVSKNMGLMLLNCSKNQLTDIDISKNIEITRLDCSDNKLNNLDISKNIKLDSLYCSKNQLTDIDVSKNIEITYLDCSENQLNNLDISKNIKLEEFNCSKNQLTDIDVSKNIEITYLDCSENQLNNLDISKNIKLGEFNCSKNQLNNLDLTSNISLTRLDCYGNQINNLDLTNNINIVFLHCRNNQLNKLDISKNIKLASLSCHENQITDLDVSKNTELRFLFCNDNILDSLDISPLPSLVLLNCCNQAEGFILYLTNKQNKRFNEYDYCDAILKEKDGSICEIEWLDIYPNPTAGKFSIESKFLSDEIKILNLAGEILYRKTLNTEKTEIDISNLPAGVYIVITKGKIGKVVKN